MPREKRYRPRRSDTEEREHLKGVIRRKDKRIRLLEREVARLTKYLRNADFDVSWDEDEPKILAPKNKDWTCKQCGSHDFNELVIPQRNCTRKYITCKDCGDRTRVIIDEQGMDT